MSLTVDDPLLSDQRLESETKLEDDDDLFASTVESLQPSKERQNEAPLSQPAVVKSTAQLNNVDETEEINLNGDDREPLRGDDVPSLFLPNTNGLQSSQDLNSLEDDSSKSVFGKSSFAPRLQLSQESDTRSNDSESRHVATTPSEADEARDEVLDITVTDPQKMGDGMGAYIAYRIITRTNLHAFKRQKFSVIRRFSDFLGLHEKLADKYLRKGRIIPPAPEKSVVGMTKVKITNNQSEQNAADFIEKRKASLERFLNRIAAHPVLRIDPHFREFLETDVELPRASSTAALSGAGVLRLFNRIGENVNKMTYHMDENDPWFQDKVQQTENLDVQLRKLHQNLENLVQTRKELSANTASFARSIAMLSNCEEHASLSRSLAQLADLEDKIEQLHNEQANSDFFILSELIKDYVGLVNAVKDVFHERVKVFQTWEHAQQTLIKKREAKAKMEISGRSDRVSIARDEVAEWEAKVDRGQEEFECISRMIKKEYEQFQVDRVKDFHTTILKYLETLLEQQQQLVQYWEAFLPEAQAISTS